MKHISVDPLSPEALADPGKFYGELAQICPVAHVETPDFSILSGYDIVKTVLTDHETWSKIYGDLLERTEYNMALSQDPPDFLEFRRNYREYMLPAGVQRWRTQIVEITNQLLDEMMPLGRGDLHDLIGKPLPVRVMSIMIGLPYRDFDKYRALADAFMLAIATEPETTQRAIDDMYSFFDTQIAARKDILASAGIEEALQEHVGSVLPDDLLSVLMSARFKGRTLTDEEIRRTLRGFFLGGIDTTGALIIHVLRRLLEDRELWDQVAANPGLIGAAIEESLRYDSPIVGMFRESTCPVEIGETTLPAETRAMFSIAGANRDPTQFQEPNRFRLDRPQSERSRHMAFGFGAHFCPGAWVARLEAEIALSEIVRRFPKLRLAGPLVRSEPFNVYEWTSLPAAWD